MDEVTAAVELARHLGLLVAEPVPLRSTNNTVIWLTPEPIVAKVSRDRTAAARELKIGRGLAERGAPVAGPADRFGDELHEVDGWFLTLWRYIPGDDGPAPSDAAIASALHALHEGLALLEATTDLPSYESQLRDAIRALQAPGFAPSLYGRDRALLQETLTANLLELQPSSAVVIHGSPHAMNILSDHGDPVFIDFETVERGPVEWDLAHLAEDVAANYPGDHDHDILAACRVAVSATTSTWCWDALHRGPDMRTHAEHHLEQVRRARA